LSLSSNYSPPNLKRVDYQNFKGIGSSLDISLKYPERIVLKYPAYQIELLKKSPIKDKEHNNLAKKEKPNYHPALFLIF